MQAMGVLHSVYLRYYDKEESPEKSKKEKAAQSRQSHQAYGFKNHAAKRYTNTYYLEGVPAGYHRRAFHFKRFFSVKRNNNKN